MIGQPITQSLTLNIVINQMNRKKLFDKAGHTHHPFCQTAFVIFLLYTNHSKPLIQLPQQFFYRFLQAALKLII